LVVRFSILDIPGYERRCHNGDKCADGKRRTNRQAIVLQKAKEAHNANACRYKQKRQVSKNAGRSCAEILGTITAPSQPAEQERHTANWSGKREAEYTHSHLAGGLETEENDHTSQRRHGRCPLGKKERKGMLN
jgi:hypothetical protein